MCDKMQKVQKLLVLILVLTIILLIFTSNITAKRRNYDMHEIIRNFTIMSNDEFNQYFMKNKYYRKGIIYNDFDDWRERQQVTTNRPFNSLRFYQKLNDPIICNINISSTMEEIEQNMGKAIFENGSLRILGFVFNKMYVTLQLDETKSQVRKISIIKSDDELDANFVFNQIERIRYLREAMVADEDWIVSPKGTKLAACIPGMRPIEDSTIYIRFRDNEYPPYSFNTIHGCRALSWLNDRYFIYQVYSHFPYIYDTKKNINKCIISPEEYGQRGYYDDRAYKIIGSTIETTSRSLDEVLKFTFSFDQNGNIKIMQIK